MVAAVDAKTLTLVRTLKAAPQQVYQYLTLPDKLAEWIADTAHVNAVVGGYLLLAWNGQGYTTGEYKHLEANKSVSFTWQTKTSETLVEFVLEEAGEGTRLSLIHHGLHESEYAGYADNWQWALNNLISTLETGADSRITSRVLIGIIPGQITEERAARLGLQPGEGVLLANVLPNFSAAGAGLQADDVIVSIDGIVIGPQNPITTIIRSTGKLPGDIVSVIYYHGEERKTVELTLKGYPVPSRWDDINELAQNYKQITDGYLTTFRTLIEGAGEPIASKRPAPTEWSAKEVLAHLILHERYIQDWVGSFMQGDHPTSYTCNTPARIASITTAFPSAQDVLNEMARAYRETVALMSNIPVEHQANHRFRWAIAFEMQEMHWHVEGHIQQIRAAIEAVQASIIDIT